MNALSQILVGIIVLALVAVLVSSKNTSSLVTAAGNLLVSLTQRVVGTGTTGA